MENQEALQPGALVGLWSTQIYGVVTKSSDALLRWIQLELVSHQFADPVQHQFEDFCADGVVAAGVVIGSVFLPSDQLIWVEQFPVFASAYLVCGES